ncbi:MAG: hypothetical protein AVDCRST_MAG13-2919, partial [uncultured Solirubrobacteraceae bacterium]
GGRPALRRRQRLQRGARGRALPARRRRRAAALPDDLRRGPARRL